MKVYEGVCVCMKVLMKVNEGIEGVRRLKKVHEGFLKVYEGN